MDIDAVRNMIGRGFRLGLYGHQHRNQAEPRHIYLPDRETMAVVSAGSLCAGPKDLPTGFYRQYNVIELVDDLQAARVHVRQMETAQVFSKAHLSSVGGRSYVDLTWETPKEIAARVATARQTPYARPVLQAERLVKAQKFDEAFSLLEPLAGALEGYGRTVLFDAARGAQRWDVVIKYGQTPQSIEELTTLVQAYEHTGQISHGRDALSRYATGLRMPDTIKRELEKRLEIREKQSK
jgi:hypothetical protein